MGEFEVGGGSGDVGKEPAVMAQPQPSGTSTNPFVMPAPTANETTTLNFQDTTTYTPGTDEEKKKHVTIACTSIKQDPD